MTTENGNPPEPWPELERHVRAAVRQGMRDVLSDREAIDAFWSAAFDVMQTRATTQTGRFVLGGVRAAMHRAAWFLALGLVVYSMGGWTAVTKLFHTLWPD